MLILGCRQAVRQGTLTPSCASSNLAAPTTLKTTRAMVVFCFTTAHYWQDLVMRFASQANFVCNSRPAEFATVVSATPTTYSVTPRAKDIYFDTKNPNKYCLDLFFYKYKHFYVLFGK